MFGISNFCCHYWMVWFRLFSKLFSSWFLVGHSACFHTIALLISDAGLTKLRPSGFKRVL